MNAFQKFLFDVKGWVVLPAVVGAAEVERIKSHLAALRESPESLPEHQRSTFAGPCGDLLDHPVLVEALRDLIGPDLGPNHVPTVDIDQPAESAAYAFRCDNSFLAVRHADKHVNRDAHNGGPTMGPTHNYQWVAGRMFSPSVRVVWELNPVRMNGGGTVFFSGTHKANFPMPPVAEIDDRYFESYECPAGSLVLFSENVCHGSATWRDETHPRMAIFNHYTHYTMRFHPDVPPAALIDTMPPLRRTLFRDVWTYRFERRPPVPNNYENAGNRAQVPAMPDGD